MADRIVVLKDGVFKVGGRPRRCTSARRTSSSPAYRFPRYELHRARPQGNDATFTATFDVPACRYPRGGGYEAYAGREGVWAYAQTRRGRPTRHGLAGRTSTIEVEPRVIERMGSEKYVYFGLPENHAIRLDAVEALAGDGRTAPNAPGTADKHRRPDGRARRGRERGRMGEKMRLTITPPDTALDPDTNKALLKARRCIARGLHKEGFIAVAVKLQPPGHDGCVDDCTAFLTRSCTPTHRTGQ